MELKLQSSHIPACFLLLPTASPSITVQHPLQIMNPDWHIIITPNPPFTLKFTLGCVYSMGFNNYIMTSIFHCVWYHTEYFHCPENSMLWLFIHSPLPTLGNYWSFYCLHRFAFSRMLQGWNLTAGSLFRLFLLLTNMHLRFLYLFHGLIDFVFFALVIYSTT